MALRSTLLAALTLLTCAAATKRCQTAADCQPGEMCRLQAGGRCCWPRRCAPACGHLERCVKSRPTCAAAPAGPCACAPTFACHRMTGLPVALPASMCQPACANGTLCMHRSGTRQYRCLAAVDGCRHWWDCTVGQGGDDAADRNDTAAAV